MHRAPRIAARSSLSRRLLRLTFCLVLLVQVLVFVPSMIRERRDWLQDRLVHGQLAALALGDFRPVGALSVGRSLDLSAREQLLAVAGAESVRLLPPGGQPIELNSRGEFEASRVIDLPGEGDVAALRETAAAILGASDGLVAVQAPSPAQPDTLVTVVFRAGDLTAHLRGAAQELALIGLAVAAIAGLFVHLALRALLVRPLRRLTDSIAAFRADPERAPPLDTGAQRDRDDEVAVAGRELAEMQRELRGALWRYARLAALGTAVAKVSHDLRGILAPALLGAERLQSHADPTVRRIGDQLVRSVERATDLVRGGLEFAREGPVTLVRRRFPLADVVAEAAEQIQAMFGSVAIDNLIDPALEVDADREHLHRVFTNLLRNAAESGASSVVVTGAAAPVAGASVASGDTVVNVTDNGPGLLDRVRADLFKPFVMGARKGSTGLGLAIARDLMRAHRGDITLLQSSPEGTVFQLTLPPTLFARPPMWQAAAAE